MYRLYTDKGILKNIYGLGFGYKYSSNEKYTNNDDKYKDVSYSFDYIDAIQSEYSLRSQFEAAQAEKIIKHITEDLKFSSIQNTGWFQKIEEEQKKKEIFTTKNEE